MIMENLILLNGSPQMKGSTSMNILDSFKACLGNDFNVNVVEANKSILQKTQLHDYETMEKADTIVLAFPLYVYCLPGVLEEFLVGYRDYIGSEKKVVEQKIYAIINCGFPESRINEEAALVIKSFCKEVHAQYRFSILLGGGGMLQPLKTFPFVNKMWKKIELAFNQIVSNMGEENGKADIYIDSKMPKKLFSFIAETNFKVAAKKKGIKKKEIFDQPYRDEKESY